MSDWSETIKYISSFPDEKWTIPCDIWCKGSSDAKVLAFFSAKSEWRETTRRFRPLQTSAVGLSGVYVNEACMLKFGAEFNCGVPVRMKPNGFLCSRTGTWIGEIFIQ